MVDGIPPAVGRAISVLRAHEAVSVDGVTMDGTAAPVIVNATFQVGLPSRLKAQGHGAHGVRESEPVRIIFPADFPLHAPRLQLRPDFSRSMPHIQPYLDDGHPVPCLFDINLSEAILIEGFAEVVNQMQRWLHKAALDQLTHPGFWEPVRRDSLDDDLVADADHLRSFVDRAGGFKFFQTLSFRSLDIDRSPVMSAMARDPLPMSTANASAIIKAGFQQHNGNIIEGLSVGLLLWPPKRQDGTLLVTDQYLPESVSDFATLRDRAVLYGVQQQLSDALALLERAFRGLLRSSRFPLNIVIAVHRPFNIFGSDTTIELCPYVLYFGCNPLFKDGDREVVRPTSLLENLNQKLLARLSGTPVRSEPWVLLGAGSLGSKIGIHLAQSGDGPSIVVDHSALRPHNAARHALHPDRGIVSFDGITRKAEALAGAIQCLDQSCTADTSNLIDVCTSAKPQNRPWGKRTWAVVNTTASASVRDALMSIQQTSPCRIIDCGLFAAGAVGTMLVEGPAHRPSAGLLLAEAYRLFGDSPTLRANVFNEAQAGDRIEIGQGCGSQTLAMPDALLSLHAASMSQAILRLRDKGLPADGGSITLTYVNDRIALNAEVLHVSPSIVFSPDNAPDWQVEISPRVHLAINTEVANWKGVETGGIILGRVSEIAKTIYVVDVINAPSDSTRSATAFVLGKQGVRSQLFDYGQLHSWSIYCLGTWHNHLRGSGPSSIDINTSKSVGIARITPSLLLISTPLGYRGVLAGN